jgi:cyclic dehypoxanthinyl futalosine synthase
MKPTCSTSPLPATMMFGYRDDQKDLNTFVDRDVRHKNRKKPRDFCLYTLTFQDADTCQDTWRSQPDHSRRIYPHDCDEPDHVAKYQNIQASWLTVGKQTAQVCLHAGANDFGSIMLEENVVSAAGAPHRFTSKTIQAAIREAGFIPQLRNQQYEFRDLPEFMEEQVIDY